MLKKGVNSRTETRKLSLITKPLDKLSVASPFFQEGPHPLPFFQFFHGKSPNLPDNLFAMYH